MATGEGPVQVRQSEQEPLLVDGQQRTPSPARPYDPRMEGPLYRVQCLRCKIAYVVRLAKATEWLQEHNAWHVEQREAGKPY